jgi:hypothetical protein
MTPTVRNWLIGCGATVGLLLLLGVVTCASFVVWLNRPGELLRPETLMGADTSGFAEWTLEMDDPGTKATVESALERLDETQQRNNPLSGLLGGWLSRFQANRNRQKVNQLLPMVVVWSLRPGVEPDADLSLFSISMKNAGNRLVFADWIFGLTMRLNSAARITEYRGENIYEFPAGPDAKVGLFIRGNDIFIASDVATARVAVDRMTGSTAAAPAVTDGTPGSSAAPPPSLDALYALTPEAARLRGALTNRRGEISRLVGKLVQEDDPDAPVRQRWGGLRGIALQASFETGSALAGRILLVPPDEGWARAHAGELATDLNALFEAMRIGAETSSTREGDRIAVDFRIEDLPAQIDSFLQSRMRTRIRRRNR